MSLDLDRTDPMYLLGRFVATIEGTASKPIDRHVLGGSELEILLRTPAKGFGMLQRKFWRRMSDPDVAKMIAILPTDLPRGPIPVADHGLYWLGYYDQRSHDRRNADIAGRLDASTLRRVGEALFGPDRWQAEMARALGLDNSASLRQWIGENPVAVPAGICRDLAAMLHRKSAETKALADEIGAGARDLSAPGRRPGDPGDLGSETGELVE